MYGGGTGASDDVPMVMSSSSVSSLFCAPSRPPPRCRGFPRRRAALVRGCWWSGTPLPWRPWIVSNETAVGAGNWSKGCVCKGPRERVVEADERSWHRTSRAGAHKGAEGGRDILDESGRDGCAGRHKERRRTPFVPSLFPLVFPPPPPFLSVIVLSVVVVILVASVVVVVDARTFAMIGVPSGGVGVGALVERDATAVETVERTERDSDWCRRGVEGMRVHEAEGTSEGLRRTSGSWRVTKLIKWSRARDAKLSPSHPSLTQLCPRANLNLRPLALASTPCTPTTHFLRLHPLILSAPCTRIHSATTTPSTAPSRAPAAAAPVLRPCAQRVAIVTLPVLQRVDGEGEECC